MTEQQVVWVTGAGRGIGRETADLFHQQGAQVVGFDCNFPNEHYAFSMIQLDITDAVAVARACQTQLGQTPRVDVLVNAAGVLHLGRSDEITLSQWQHSFDTNVSGPFYLMRELTGQFKAQGSGAIVNVASNAAHTPRLGMAAYCPSKAALVSLSNCVALELAPFGIRCNVISPGSTDTPMLSQILLESGARGRLIEGVSDQYKLGIPLGRIGTPLDIAEAIAFLASDKARHITMQNLVIDGGATLGH